MKIVSINFKLPYLELTYSLPPDATGYFVIMFAPGLIPAWSPHPARMLPFSILASLALTRHDLARSTRDCEWGFKHRTFFFLSGNF